MPNAQKEQSHLQIGVSGVTNCSLLWHFSGNLYSSWVSREMIPHPCVPATVLPWVWVVQPQKFSTCLLLIVDQQRPDMFRKVFGDLYILPCLQSLSSLPVQKAEREVLWTKHFYFKCSKGESRKRKWNEWEFWNSEKRWCLWLGVIYHSSFLLLLLLFFFCSNYSWLIIKDTKLYGALMPSQVHHAPSIYMW